MMKRQIFLALVFMGILIIAVSSTGQVPTRSEHGTGSNKTTSFRGTCPDRPVPTDTYRPAIVRVAVIKDAPQLELSIKSEFRITPIEIDEVLYSQKNLISAKVLPFSWGVKIADKEFKLYGVRIIPSADSTIFINKRSFRGQVDIIRQRNETLLVVNHVNVEDYLKGVLHKEVSHWWPMAALQAQAIVARTFALYQAGINKDKDYDLESTVYSQVYGGSISEKARTNRAVYKTLGEVLTYKSELFPAYYHATCGGHTEDASVLWKTDLEPLRGVNCNFCRNSPHFYWKRRIPVSDIEKALSIDRIQDIFIKESNNSGRVVLLQIQTAKGPLDYMAKDFRQKLGTDVIKSTIFKIEIKPDINSRLFAEIDGVGWGHGVGMCQWGAFGMALRGYKLQQILEYYYPGAKIEAYAGR
jgi:stage II sporulation protein D